MPEESAPNPSQEPCGEKQSNSHLTAVSYKDQKNNKKKSLLY